MTPSHLPSPIFHFLSFPFLSFPFFSFISILSLPLCPSLSFVPCAEQSNKQLIDQGRKWMDETDASLERSRRVVEQTRQVGAETAAALHEQTIQMERVVNKLDEMQVSVNPPPTLPSAPTRQHAHTHTHALAHSHAHHHPTPTPARGVDGFFAGAIYLEKDSKRGGQDRSYTMTFS